MTIEEEFFKAFGIEKRCKDTKIIACSGRNSGCRKCNIFDYPKITAEKLLQLICILSTAIKLFKTPPHLTTEGLKKHILRNCINCQEGIYTRVRKLFEE